MFASVKSLGVIGIDSYIVNVEVDVSNTLPSFDIVGLPDTAVRESRDRVKSAISNCGYSLPIGKITVNLAPADLKKHGPLYDLPILIGILKATGQLYEDLDDFAFVGELSLSGDIKPVNGVLPMTLLAKENNINNIFLPVDNQNEAAVIRDINVFGVSNISEVILHIQNFKKLCPAVYSEPPADPLQNLLDLCDVKGQSGAKRALEIAAAGGHNLLMIGSPGSGKSMLAKRVVSILPDMTFDESIETTKIHSIAGVLNKDQPIVTSRPFRSPHHSTSKAGLSGGGSIPKPGEVSLAHNGVLFLDELPEFTRDSMEVLRQPMEDSQITISRVNSTLTYPSSFMLIAAMNPCPCGYFGHPEKKCICKPNAAQRYLSKVSGPLLDRLDIHVEVLPVEFQSLVDKNVCEKSSSVRARVNKARAIQNDRFKGTAIHCNAKITPAKLNEFCKMSDDAMSLLKNAFERLNLSARAYDKILKIARTIADLDEQETIAKHHIAEAIQYRTLDRKYWSGRTV